MFENFTKDQRESVVLITILLFFATICVTGAFLLGSQYFFIAFLLGLSGVFLAAIAVSGYFIEFVNKKETEDE